MADKQIHELNTAGTLGSVEYIAIDDGTDTRKTNLMAVTALQLDATLSDAEKAAQAAAVGEFRRRMLKLTETTRNLLYLRPITKNGITITEPGAEWYRADGQATNGTYLPLCDTGETSMAIPAGTYTFGVFYADSSNVMPNVCGLYYGSSANAGEATLATRNGTVTLTFEDTTYIFLRIANNGTTYNGMAFRVMVSKGEDTSFINSQTAIDYYARGWRECNAMVMRSGTASAYIAYDYAAKTVTVYGATYAVGKDGRHVGLREQTLDMSGIATTYNAYRILLDKDGYLHAKAWTDDTDTGYFCIGCTFERYFQIFGISDVMSSGPQEVFCFGDSITAGVSASKPWHQILGEHEHVVFRNWGIGGTGYANAVTGDARAGQGCIGQGTTQTQSGSNTVVDVMSGKTFDACIIFAGTNDYGNSIELSTFRTAVQNTLTAALSQTSNVLVITPLKRYYQGKAYTEPNGKGAVLKDYADIIKEECSTRKILCFDGFDVPLDPTDMQQRSRLTADGLHPNNAGHQRIAGAIRTAVESVCGVL